MDHNALLGAIDQLGNGRSMVSGLLNLLCSASGAVEAEGLASLLNAAEREIVQAEERICGLVKGGGA